MFFATTDKAITLIYHSEDQTAKEILAYSQMESLPLHEINISNTTLNSVHWIEIAGILGVNIKDLINIEHPNFKQKFPDNYDFSNEDWLILLENNPEILRAPIVMKGKTAVMMNNSQDMLNFVK